MRGDGARMPRLLELRIEESDRECAHRLRTLRLHHRDDSGRVNATGEEGSERYVGHHLVGYRLPQQDVELVDQLRIGLLRWARHAGASKCESRPVRGDRWSEAVARAEGHHGAGRDLADAAVDRVGRGYVTVAHEQCDGARIGLTDPVRMRAQGLELRAKHKRVAAHAVVERLLADAVARQDERLLAHVPDG